MALVRAPQPGGTSSLRVPRGIAARLLGPSPPGRQWQEG